MIDYNQLFVLAAKDAKRYIGDTLNMHIVGMELIEGFNFGIKLYFNPDINGTPRQLILDYKNNKEVKKEVIK